MVVGGEDVVVATVQRSSGPSSGQVPRAVNREKRRDVIRNRTIGPSEREMCLPAHTLIV
jgi:hypothetical protein